MAVYFAAAGGYIKIGYSADPVGRMNTVTRNGSRPEDLERGAHVDLLGWIPGDRSREHELHDQFAGYRARGEWFDIDAETVADLIWSDPCGVDIERMSALAVFAMRRHPHATRAMVEECGIPVEAVPLGDIFAGLLTPSALPARRPA